MAERKISNSGNCYTSRPRLPSDVADASDFVSSVVGVLPMDLVSPLSERCFSEDDDAVSAAFKMLSSSEPGSLPLLALLALLCLPLFELPSDEMPFD